MDLKIFTNNWKKVDEFGKVQNYEKKIATKKKKHTIWNKVHEQWKKSSRLVHE